MVRYDGATVPGNPHHVPPTPSDPRKKLPSALWKRLESMDLPVPRFKVRIWLLQLKYIYIPVFNFH